MLFKSIRQPSRKPSVFQFLVVLLLLVLVVNLGCSSRRKGRNKKCNCPSIGWNANSGLYASISNKTTAPISTLS
ncbi:MAG: hypothetical protein EBR22_02250 [Cytophagia bacterium]|nr:hypothetical protein [Cytophagia bacterium]